jgi:hypothetical protein
MGGGANSRAGRWIFATGFENDPLGYGPINLIPAGGVGGTAKIITLLQPTSVGVGATIWQGNQCCEIKTAASVNSEAAIDKYIPWQSGVCGIECFFCQTVDDMDQYEIMFDIIRFGYLGKLSQGQLVIRRTNVDPAIYTVNAGVLTQITSLAGYLDAGNIWHYFKFVFDPNNNKYIRGFFDNLTFDFGGVPGYQILNSGFGDRFRILLRTLNGSAKTLWVDNLIITGDEP